MKLDSGIGKRTKEENNKTKKPIILSARVVVMKSSRGRKMRSTLRIYGEDLFTRVASTDLFTVSLENFFGNFGALYPADICKAKTTSGIEMMLGNGGGVGMMMPKAKIIITSPNPTESMACTRSRIGMRSAEELLTTSSMTCVVIILC